MYMFVCLFVCYKVLTAFILLYHLEIELKPLFYLFHCILEYIFQVLFLTFNEYLITFNVYFNKQLIK